MAIKTPEDWWDTVDEHWPNILDIFMNCGAPFDSLFWSDSAGREPTAHPKTLLMTLEEAKRDKDHEALGHLLQLCWDAAPDEAYIHSWPSWSQLCDLCSEDWVFDEEQWDPARDPINQPENTH